MSGIAWHKYSMHRILGRCQSLGYNRDLPFDSGVALHADSPEWLKATAQKGIGCRRCNQTGCKRRIGVYEIFVVDNELRRMIHGNASEGQLMRSARQSGMATLLDDAIAKVEAGFTTCEEVLRVFGPQNALEIPCEGCGANLEERFHF